ncbi:MAG: dienelactone hydrolase family protein [Minicystis sp.]
MTQGANRARPVIVDTGDAELEGDLTLTPGAPGIVVFAHGSGSSRRSPRNRSVAAALQQRGLATLLFDLLTPDEEIVDQRDASIRFDIELLGRRLVGAVDWLAQNTETKHLPAGVFGASTGAAAALIAAAERPTMVRAVVSRGGRVDLACASLTRVVAPTLLLVGGLDDQVLELNRQTYAYLTCERRLEIVPGASHLFAEPGALERVSARAGEWFAEKLALAAKAA